MIFIKAVWAFLKVFLGGGECEHLRVNLSEAPAFCPDCGYSVTLEWLFVHCRGCNARRVPQQSIFGKVKPLHQFCRHCGTEGFKIVKKSRIEAYELMYALSIKSTLYGDPEEVTQKNPFRTSAFLDEGDVFDAEILNKNEFSGTKSAFRASPFDWQKSQSPKRYGGSQSSFYSSGGIRRIT